MRTASAAALAVLAALALAGGSAAGGSSRFVSVWLPYWAMDAAASSTLMHADQIAVASPVWYSVTASGAVTDLSGGSSTAAALVAALQARGVEVVPTVIESTGLSGFDRMLASAVRREALVRALVAIARRSGYSGLDLDFEQFAVDPQDQMAAAREAAAGYPRLVGELCRALHETGRTCIVTVMPRTSSARALWRGRLATWVYDYAALGAVADRVRIMAYDEHAPGSPAGPVAPYGWVQHVIAYARSQIPAAKTELGLAAYGYTWPLGGGGGPFTAADAGAIASAHHAKIQWSPSAAEEHFSYGPPGHTTVAWFEDTRADVIRARLARAAGFAGVSVWAAGYEAPAFWTALGPLSPAAGTARAG